MDREVVVVPDVVGLPFHIARDRASEAGVALADPDPDAPPIANSAWPGLFYVTAQSPVAGTPVYRWDSVVVEVRAFDVDGGEVAARPLA